MSPIVALRDGRQAAQHKFFEPFCNGDDLRRGSEVCGTCAASCIANGVFEVANEF